MAVELLCCPYCNSAVPVGPAEDAGQAVQCPRCQEMFPYRAGERGREIGEAITPNGVPQLKLRPSHTPASRQRWSNRAVAGVILATMGTMALIGFLFAWNTIESRRKRDKLGDNQGQELTRVIAVAPARLTALGYLPADTNIVAGVHVAELLGEPAVREFLVASRPAGGGWNLASLEHWTGLKLEEIDHAVLGLRVEDRLFPRITLIVQTRKPYQAGAIRQTLKAERSLERGKRTLYRFHINQSGIEAVLWCANECTLVFTIFPEDLDVVPTEPVPGVERLSPELQNLLGQQMHEGTQLWIAGAAKDWIKALSPQPFPGMPRLATLDLARSERDLLTHLRAFGAWLQIDQDVVWNLAAEGTDSAALPFLDEYLALRGLEQGQPLESLEKRSGLQLLARELSESRQRTQKGDWIYLQARSSLEGIRQAAGSAR
jgi:hypothetical protein